MAIRACAGCALLCSFCACAQSEGPGVTMVPPRIATAAGGLSGRSAATDAEYALGAWIAPMKMLNARFPKWIQFQGLDRIRFERQLGQNYQPGNDDSYVLNRFRLGMTVRTHNWLLIHAEAQDSRVYCRRPPQGPPDENKWDLRQAFLQFGGSEDAIFNLKVGRQEMNFGAGRVMGRSDWRNAGRTFDAVHAALHLGRFRLSAFSASRVKPLAEGISHHQDGNVIHGLYGAIDNWIQRAVLEPYVLWKLAPDLRTDAGLPAKMTEQIAGVRWAGLAKPSFDYAFEAAGQTGSIGADSIGAAMVSVVGGYTAAAKRGKPRVFAEYFFASGDESPGDHRRGTWDQLHPTHHDRHGLADQIGFQNLKEFRAGLRLSPARNWTVAIAYSDWHLANAKDGLYDTGPTVIARDPTGRSGTHIGQELDLQTSYRLSREIEIGAGVGRIFPGRFLKRTTPGDTYTYPYVMMTYSFR